jgi:hypothetical protein
VKRQRLVIGTAGVLLGLFGVLRLLTEIPLGDLLVLAGWLIGAVVIHDGILSPIIVALGWTIGRLVPPRARRYLQFALIVAGLVTIVAIPLIYREDTQPASEAILQQRYGLNLTVLLGMIAAITLIAYALQVAWRGGLTTPRSSPMPAARSRRHT